MQPVQQRDQVDTKHTVSQNHKYLELCIQHLYSVSCKMLPVKLFIDAKMFDLMAVVNH